MPAEEQVAFVRSAETDPFIIRQAVAILEGSESLGTAAASLQLATEERFVPQAGLKIGRYRVGTLLGAGGAGSVYAAFDEELNRPIAIKFVPPVEGRFGRARTSLAGSASRIRPQSSEHHHDPRGH